MPILPRLGFVDVPSWSSTIQDVSRSFADRRAAAEAFAAHIREHIARMRALPESPAADDPLLAATFGPLFEFALVVPPDLVPEPDALRGWLEYAVDFHTRGGLVGGEIAFRRLLATEHRRRDRLEPAFDVLAPLADRQSDGGDQLAAILIELGAIEQARGRMNEALAWYTRAANHCESDRARFVFDGAIARVKLSYLYRSLGVVDLATKQQESALEWATEFGHDEALFNARVEGVRVALARPGVYEVANEIADLRGHPLAKANPGIDAELHLCELMSAGRVLDLDDTEGSRLLGARFLEFAALDSTPSELRERALFWTISLANRRGDRECVAEAAARSRFVPNQDVERGEAGQQRAQLLYHRALVEYESLDGHPEEERRAAVRPWFEALVTQFLAVRAEWLAIPAHESGNAVLHYAGRRDVVAGAMHLALVALGDEAGRERAIEFWLAVQGIGSLTRDLALPDPTRKDVSESLLAPDEGLLGFLPSEVGTIVLAIDEAGLAVVVGPTEVALDATCAAFESHVLTRPRTTDSKEQRADLRHRADLAARALAAELLPMRVVDRMRSWKRVAVAGADLLRTPFVDALILPGDSDPLGVMRAVRHLPSVALGLHLRRGNPAPAAGTLRLLAAPPVDADLAQEFGITAKLPFDATTESRLLREIARERRSVAARSDATETALFDASTSNCATLCILAHGIQRIARTRPAAFVLAADDHADGIVECAAIEAMHSPATVIVATCGAARGPRRFGDEGVQHLGGAFFRAGARSVAISPVDLDYEGTLRLLELALPALARGVALADALHEARRAMRSDPRFDHPSLYLTLQAFGA